MWRSNNSLLTVVPGSVKYPIPYACQLASFNAYMSCCVPLVFLLVSHLLSLFSHLVSLQLGSAAPFYLGCSLIEPLDNLSGYVYLR